MAGFLHGARAREAAARTPFGGRPAVRVGARPGARASGFAAPALVYAALALLAPGAAAQQPGAAAQRPVELRLRPGDAVRIEVRDEPSLGGQFQVGDDGAILIPGIGILAVAGRPMAEVEAEVRRAYARELADPVLRVVPLVRVAVLGEVARPGLFPVDPTHTLADVLATVGGLTPLADRGNIVLVRDGVRRRLRLDPGSAALAEPLRSGDRIVVGRRSWFSENLAIFVGAAASVAAAAVTSLIVR